MKNLFVWPPQQVFCTAALAVIAVKVTLFALTFVPPIRIATGN